MADPGTFYCAYTDVQQLLNNANIGAANIYPEASLQVACTVSQAKIHTYLGIRSMTKTTDVVFKEVLKAIQIDLIMMRVLQGRAINENNLSDPSAIQNYWSLMPALTNEHKRMLDMIKEFTDGTSWVFDIRSGDEVLI